MVLLDTNVLSEVLRKQPTLVVLKSLHALRPEERFASEVTRYELRVGAARLDDGGRLWRRLQQDVLPLVRWLPLDTAAALAAADIGADAYVTLASSGPAIEGFEFSGSRTFIVPGSWLGFPAFSLPLMHADGLPFGLQLLGIDHRDGNLCATANWVMQTLAGD